jgi:hypothetical protein
MMGLHIERVQTTQRSRRAGGNTQHDEKHECVMGLHIEKNASTAVSTNSFKAPDDDQ